LRKLNNAEITAKCVEISKCLIDLHGGMVQFDLNDTQTIGDTTRLAVSIRNRSEVIPREVFAGISSAVKVSYPEARILPILEQLNWVDVKRTGSKIESITEKIPPTEDVLSTLGKMWQEQEPTPVDEASVRSLAELSKRPYSKEALISDLGVKDKEFEAVYDYGDQARYLGKFVSEESGTEAIWTPLYWAGNMEAVIRFLQKQSEPKLGEIGTLVDRFRNHPGTPNDKIDARALNLVNAGISHGFFPSVEVKNRQGTSYEYVFAAAPQFDTDNKSDVFEKARMIVACIRHGQHHADISRIKFPRLILDRMRHSAMNPHPYADVQYAILVVHGIVKLEPSRNRYGKAFKVMWIDTPENNLAYILADQLLIGSEILGTSKEELEAQKVLVQGVFNYSSEQRRLKTGKRIVATHEFDRLMELMTGVSR